MQVLVNGCSFSRGPNSWPYFLPFENITNLAQAGAGNTYIQESTISELSQRSYDLVLIMWTAIERVDFKVEDLSVFSDSRYTSLYQHTKNDWETKIVHPFNDQDLVEKDWVFGCGHINGEPEMINTGMFDGIYKNQNENQFVYHFLQKVLALQNYLKINHIPYVFSFFRDYQHRLSTVSHLYKELDLSNICTNHNIDIIAHENNWYDLDGIHPGPDAHKKWAEILLEHLKG